MQQTVTEIGVEIFGRISTACKAFVIQHCLTWRAKWILHRINLIFQMIWIICDDFQIYLIFFVDRNSIHLAEKWYGWFSVDYQHASMPTENVCFLCDIDAFLNVLRTFRYFAIGSWWWNFLFPFYRHALFFCLFYGSVRLHLIYSIHGAHSVYMSCDIISKEAISKQNQSKSNLCTHKYGYKMNWDRREKMVKWNECFQI